MSAADLEWPPAAWPHQPPSQPPAPAGGSEQQQQPAARPTAPPTPVSTPAGRRRPRWGCGDVAWAILLMLGLLLFVTEPLVAAAFAPASAAAIVAQTGTIWIALGGWALFCSWVKGLGSLKLDFGWAFRWYDVFIGLSLAMLMIVLRVVTYALRQMIDVQSATNTQPLKEQVKGGASWGFIVVALVVSIGAPIVEELFFRGLTYSAFAKRWGPAVAVIASSLIFGLMHYQPGPLVPTLFLLVDITIFGVVLGLSRRYFGRTGPGVFAHMFFNLLPTLAILSTAAAMH